MLFNRAQYKPVNVIANFKKTDMRLTAILSGLLIFLSCRQNSVESGSQTKTTHSEPLLNSDDFRGRTVLGEKYAKTELEKVIKNPTENLFYNKTIIKDKETAVGVAEQILFSIYGKAEIVDQRPYEVYSINNHWVISGTLPTDKLGGTFLIIINSVTGQIVKLTHGK